MKNLLKTWIASSFTFLFAFLFNFVWETLHAVYLYKDHNFLALPYVRMVMYASTVDASLILLIFFSGYFLFEKKHWLQNYKLKQSIFTIIFALLIAIIIEVKAVYVFKQWSYNALMPVIMGIGLSPLVQLAVTGWLSMLLTSVLLYKKY